VGRGRISVCKAVKLLADGRRNVMTLVIRKVSNCIEITSTHGNHTVHAEQRSTKPVREQSPIIVSNRPAQLSAAGVSHSCPGESHRCPHEEMIDVRHHACRQFLV